MAATITSELVSLLPQVFFDSSPDSHARHMSCSPASATSPRSICGRCWRSKQILRQWRDDPDALAATAELATNKATLEEVFHPSNETPIFEEPDDIADAIDDGELAPLPDDPVLGWEPDPDIGQFAAELDQSPELYRALKPGALATLTYIGGVVRNLADSATPLQVTSAVRDRSYQELLIAEQPAGDGGVLAAHDRLVLRRSPRLRIRASGARLSVRPRPAAGARRARLRGRAGRDPRHRLEPRRRTAFRVGPYFWPGTSTQRTRGSRGMSVGASAPVGPVAPDGREPRSFGEPQRSRGASLFGSPEARSAPRKRPAWRPGATPPARGQSSQMRARSPHA